MTEAKDVPNHVVVKMSIVYHVEVDPNRGLTSERMRQLLSKVDNDPQRLSEAYPDRFFRVSRDPRPYLQKKTLPITAKFGD